MIKLHITLKDGTNGVIEFDDIDVNGPQSFPGHRLGEKVEKELKGSKLDVQKVHVLETDSRDPTGMFVNLNAFVNTETLIFEPNMEIRSFVHITRGPLRIFNLPKHMDKATFNVYTTIDNLEEIMEHNPAFRIRMVGRNRTVA